MKAFVASLVFLSFPVAAQTVNKCVNPKTKAVVFSDSDCLKLGLLKAGEVDGSKMSRADSHPITNPVDPSGKISRNRTTGLFEKQEPTSVTTSTKVKPPPTFRAECAEYRWHHKQAERLKDLNAKAEWQDKIIKNNCTRHGF